MTTQTEFNFPKDSFGYVPGTVPAKMIYSAVQPENPIEGLWWVQTSELGAVENIYFYTGSAWLFFGLNSGVVISETEPANPRQGMRWFNLSEPRLYVYYEDVDSGQWIEEVTQGVDANLRSDLGEMDSVVPVAGIPAKAFKNLDGVKALTQTPGVTMSVKGFYAGTKAGGGDFYYDTTVSKTLHNGGTVISPEALAAWAGTVATITTLLNWTGTGSGCFVRTNFTKVNPYMFGAVNGSEDSSAAINASIKACLTGGKWEASGTVSIFNTVNINGPKNSEFNGASFKMEIRANVVGLVVDNMDDCELSLGAVMGVQGVFEPNQHPVILKSITASTIRIRNTRYCTKGVRVDPVGDSGGVDPTRTVNGFYYNQIYLSKLGSDITDHGLYITTTTNPLHPTPAMAVSYVNENEWYLKNVRCTGSGVKTVKSASQTDRFNGNIFHNTGLEAVKGIGFDFSYTEGNHVLMPRFESPDDFGNFATALLKQDNTCEFNVYQLGRANPDRFIIQGNRTVVRGLLIDASGSNKGDEMYHTTDALPDLFSSKSAKQGLALAENYHEFIAGDTLDTSNNKPYERYAGFVKDSLGVARPHGLLSPHAAQLIASFTDGQTIDITPCSYVRVRGGSAGHVVNLKMNAQREIDGYMLLLEIDTNATSRVNILNSGGTSQVVYTAFNPTTTETRGMFAIVYRDFGWRASKISDRLLAS